VIFSSHNSALHITRANTKMQMNHGMSTALVGYYMRCLLKKDLFKVCDIPNFIMNLIKPFYSKI